jgi:hypothetical protein
MTIAETVEQAITLCDSNPELSLDNIALYITYKGEQYKLKGTNCLDEINQTPILDKDNWEDYFHTNTYLGASKYEIIAALYYKTQGYEVFLSKQGDLADRQGIDLVIIDPKDNTRCLVQVKGRCYQNRKNGTAELKYKLFGIELFVIDIDKFTSIVGDIPINKFLQDIFLDKHTTANLWEKIDLPTCELQIKEHQAFKYQLDTIKELRANGIYAIPITDKRIAYYTFSTGKWTYVPVNSKDYKEVVQYILKELFNIDSTNKNLQRVSPANCYPNVAFAVNKLKQRNFSVLTFKDNYIGVYHSGRWHYVKVQQWDSVKTIVDNVTKGPTPIVVPKAWRDVIRQLEREENITIVPTSKSRIGIKKGNKWFYYLGAPPTAKPQTIRKGILNCLALHS